MEASQAQADEARATAEDGASVFDDVKEPDKSQQPIEGDEHGTVQPSSSPPPGPHAGIDPTTGQATVPPAGAAGDGEGAAGE